MAGLGALWDPNLHPRGWHGRFIKKFKLAPWLDNALKRFSPRQFQSQGQANQFAFNQPNKLGKDILATRRVKIDFDEAADHLRNDDIDDTTKKFMEALDPHFEPAPRGGLILGRTFGPEALGLTPQQLNEDDPNGITGMMGNTIQDKMYSPTHLGQHTSHGPGKITMSIAVPEGTRVAYSGTNPNDPGVFLDRNQKLLVTRVFPDERGGWFMSVVAEPPGATSGSPVAAVEGRKGAGLTPEMREARIGGPSVFKQAAPPPSGDSTGHQLNIPGQAVEPGPPQAPEKAAAAAPARQARKAAYQQARAAEEANGGVPQGATPPPQAPQAPQPVQPTPTPASGVGERTEPVHGPIGGTPTEGKSASEIATTPPEPTPAPAPAAPQATAATFKQAFKDAGLQSPTAGAQRREFNNAYLGVTSGKKDPGDALRELDADITQNKHLLTGPESKTPHEELRANIEKQQKLADLIATHYNEPRLHKTPAPHEGGPAEAPAPAKKAFSTVKDLTPEERAHYDSLDRLGRSRYLARRRAGQEHGAAFDAVKGGEKAPAKAAPEPRKGLTTAGQESPNALPPLHTVKAEAPAAPAKAAKKAAPAAPKKESAGEGAAVLAKGGFTDHNLITGEKRTPEAPAAPVREKSPGTAEGKLTTGRLQKGDKIVVAKRADGTYGPSTRKTGGTILTVNDVGNEPGSGNRRRSTRVVNGTDENGNPISVKGIPSHQTFWEHKEKAPRATKAAPAKAVEKVSEAPSKSTATKVAKAAPAPKAVSEVQTRADEAGLPKTVTALRQAAREKKIRGFSTMNKEQLQRALLGEEVSTGAGKLGPIAPDKLSGHIEAAPTDQAARNLMEDHTVADLKALAKHNGVDLKGITRKDAIKDAVIKHIRGEGPGALRPEPPKESLLEGMAHNKILAGGLGKEPDIQRIVAGVKDDDPNALRSGRDELEKIAEDTKTSDPIRSRIAQEAADAMGMRAQQISGVEEAPTPVKGAKKVAKKAAAPKLSVHQERVRKQAIADGATEEEARAAAEAAPVRAPAGTKAATAKAAAARKAAGLPESRRDKFLRTGEFEPGPKLTAPKRAAKATTPAKEGLPSGPERVQPQGVRETPAPGAPFTPEAERKLRAAGLEPGVTGKGRPGAPEAAPVKKAAPGKASKADLLAQAKEAGLDAKPSWTKAKIEDELRLHNNRRGDQVGLHRPTKDGIPEADAAKFKAAGVKPTKVVPQGSVKGERAQTPIDNKFRAHEFDAAYMKHVDSRGNISDHAVESQDQVAADISEGRITPEEGIRRIESEISFNNDEIQQLSRDIRSGNLEGHQLNQARHDLNALERDNASHEKLSRDLHNHFGKERVTPQEVTQKIADANPNFWESLNKQDPEALRHEIQTNPDTKHLGPIQGNTTQEVFQDALKKIIKNELERRAAAKEGRAAKVAKKAVPREPGAPPAAKPEFAPGGAKHLDAKAVAGDLGVPDAALTHTQNELNAGKTPGQAADTLRRHAQGIRDYAALVGLGRSDEELAKMDPEGLKTRNQRLDDAAKMDAFAERLKGVRRPTVRKTAATKATEEIAAAKEVTKEPAAKKALAKAETAADEARVEADKLKDRIVGRHRESWEKSTNVKEAQAAADAMRKDLTLGEIRQFFDGQGIKGRTKDDILKKAVERRFGSGGDISPERVTSPAQLAKVNNRFEEANRLKQAGSGFANLDEMLANGGSERAVRHRVDTAGFSPEETARIREAALAGDRPALDKIAQEHGLTRNTGAPGSIEPFEPGKHRAITGSHRKGEAVRIVQPGYQGTVEGRVFQAHPATVIKATPEEKAQMLDRLAQQKREGIAGLPAETRAAVLARSARQAQNPIAQKLAKKAAAGKAGITPPEPLPTNKAEEVAQNMERLNAAKELKPTGDLKTKTKAELFKITEDEKIPVKKTSTKADLISSIETWRNRPAEAVAGRGFRGERPETGVQTAPILKRGEKRVREAAAPEAPRVPTKAASPAKSIPAAALPTRGPIKRAHVSFDENTSPATFGRENGNTPLRAPNGGWSSDQGLIHMDSEIGQLWQDLAKDNRLPNSDLNKITDIGQELARGDINLNQAGERLNTIRNGLTDGPLKDRFTETVRDISGPKKPDVNVPENTPQSVKDWLEKVADTPTFNKHRPGKSGTAFEELQDLVREVSEGNRPVGAETKLGSVGNVHESTDGYYALRREAGKVFSTPEARKWFMTRPTGGRPEAVKAAEVKAAEPVKAVAAKATRAKKAAPAKVTQAELRNPVEKVGNAAPSATPSEIQATGLQPGRGVPTSNFLALKNKIPRSNALTQLDTAIRIPARRSQVPELIARVETELGQAGVGPNDEPRKSLIAWYREHFKI